MQTEIRDGYTFEPYSGIAGQGGAGRYAPTPEQLGRAAVRLSSRTYLAGDHLSLDAAMLASAYLELTAPDPRRAKMHPSIMTASGRYFDFEKPETFEWNIEDIAHGLAHQCRYTGHVSRFYSIAEHSVLGSYLVDEEDQFEALMHDAHEAFCSDVATPLKILLKDYQQVENRAELAMRRHYLLPDHMTPQVKQVDMLMLAVEKRQLMNPLGGDWPILAGITPPKINIEGWEPAYARERFTDRFIELHNAHMARLALGEPW